MTEVTTVDIEGVGRFVVLMVREDYEGPEDHDIDHARGGCNCPCYPPLYALLSEAETMIGHES